MKHKYEKYIIIRDKGDKLNYQRLFADMADMRGFNAADRQKQYYDGVHEWFEQREFMKKHPNEVPF